MTFHEAGYQRYNVTMKIGNETILIATTRPSIKDIDIVYITMYVPYQEHSEMTINTKNMVGSEMIEFAKKFIMKKLYRIQNDMLQSLRSIEFENEKHKSTYTLTDVSKPRYIYKLEDKYC